MEHDRIYHNGVPAFLRECAQTPAVLRLKNVGMNCGCEYTSFPRFCGIAPYSRFEHSLGTALIVWHFTGDRVQAMAGLLHDIATPVFAHVVDFLRGDYLRQEATEAGTEAMIASSSELQALLEKYGIETGSVSDYHRYPVADNDPPRLSADRLEYTLGNSVRYGICTESAAKTFYADLIVGENEDGQKELMFQTREIAETFAEAALRCAEIYVSDEDRYAMQMLSEILRRAMEWGVLAEEDLYTGEPEVIAKLTANEKTAALWDRFRAYRRIVRSDHPLAGEGWRQIFAKKRFIDPFVCGQGRVSGLSPKFAAELRRFREQRQDRWLCGQV